MTFEGHLIFSLSNTILAKKMSLSLALTEGDWWHVIIGSVLTCLLPDLDHPRSMLGQRLKWLSSPINRIFGHRGFTHSLLAVIIIILSLISQIAEKTIIPLDALHAMIIGYMSHIIADVLTPAGVPLLWPCRYRFSIPIIRSSKNNQLERIICISLLIFSLQYQEGTPIIFHREIFNVIKVTLEKIVCNLLSSSF